MMNDLRQRYLADVVKQAELDAERFAATAPGKQPDAVFILEAWGKAVYLIPVPSHVLVVLWPTYRDALIAKAAELATTRPPLSNVERREIADLVLAKLELGLPAYERLLIPYRDALIAQTATSADTHAQQDANSQ